MRLTLLPDMAFQGHEPRRQPDTNHLQPKILKRICGKAALVAFSGPMSLLPIWYSGKCRSRVSVCQYAILENTGVGHGKYTPRLM